MSDSEETENCDTEVVPLREDHDIPGPNDSEEAFEAKLVVKGNRSVVYPRKAYPAGCPHQVGFIQSLYQIFSR